MIGVTINDTEFLDGDDGGELRRYWSIPVGKKIDLAWVKKHRDQLWAEAVHRFEAGEPWWFEPDEIAAIQRAGQRFARIDPWDDEIVAYLKGRQHVQINEILSIKLRLDGRDLNPINGSRVRKTLRRLGWRPKGDGTSTLDGMRGPWWVRDPDAEVPFEKYETALGEGPDGAGSNGGLFRGLPTGANTTQPQVTSPNKPGGT